MSKNIWLILGVLVILGGGYWAMVKNTSNMGNDQVVNPGNVNGGTVDTTPTTTPATGNPSSIPTLTIQPYGNIVLSLGQKVSYPDGYIKLISVSEDSRCPIDVQCIQAGTVKVSVEYSEKGIAKTTTLELNKSFIRSSEKIVFTDVTPKKEAGKAISNTDYRFTLNVSKTSGSPVATGGCYVGGCSSEVCSDQKNVASNCIYTAAFACYKTAKCERQASGQCGWTPTSELNACLASAR